MNIRPKKDIEKGGHVKNTWPLFFCLARFSWVVMKLFKETYV